MMGDSRRIRCVRCGGHREDVGGISWDGNCAECGERRMVENIVGIARKEGVAHRRRLRGIARYLERAMLDAGEPSA